MVWAQISDLDADLLWGAIIQVIKQHVSNMCTIIFTSVLIIKKFLIVTWFKTHLNKVLPYDKYLFCIQEY